MKWVKRGFHKFVIDENGAVTIYAIIITLLLFVFNAVLIDFIRIMAAERDADQAAKAAIRSTMSSYNQDVKSYGLFGFEGGQEGANDIFQKVFEENLKQEEGDYFRFVDTAPVDGQVTTTVDDGKMLSNKNTIEYQILEDMKYKAPMEIGKSLIEGFLSVSDAVKEVSALTDIIADISKNAKKRDEKLEEVKNKLKAAAGNANDLETLIKGDANSSFPKVNNVKDIVAQIDEYLDIVVPLEGDEEGEEEEENADKQKKAKDFEKNVAALTEKMNMKAEAVRDDLKDSLKLLEEAEGFNTKIIDKIAENRDQAEQDYANAIEASRGAANPVSGAPGSGDLANMREKITDFVMEESFFIDLKEKINQAITAAEGDNGLVPYIKNFESFTSSSRLKDASRSLLTTQSQNLSSRQTKTKGFVDEALAMIEGVETNRDEATKEEEEKAEDELDKAIDDLDKVINEAKAVMGDQTAYDELKALLSKYKGAIEASKSEFNKENPDDFAKDAMSIVDMIFKSIGDILINSRDKAYINEYILNHFKSHDFSKSGAEAGLLENNQVEYITYGLHSSGANYAAAMTELFAFRFAINLLDAFSKPGTLAGPYAWAFALSTAIIKTAEDMRTIQLGKPIRFFGKLRFQTSYRDYLRLFLFMHDEGSKIPRTMAVIEHSTKSDLTKLPTYISGEVTASVKLWFLPSVTGLLGKTAVLKGTVVNNRYYINEKVNYSY